MNDRQYANAPKFIVTSEQLSYELKLAKGAFNALNSRSGNHVDFAKEAGFVYQLAIESMKYPETSLMNSTLQTIINSFLTIGKTGLSIEPGRQFAHLKTIYNHQTDKLETQFDFNYRGYLKLASRSKVIRVITSDVVYANDDFTFNGARALVTHRVRSLSPRLRGDFAGGYCSSELIDSTIVTTVMSPEEVLEIEANAKRYENSAWNSVYIDEMRRKTFIKRHWKTLSTIVQSMQGNTILPVMDNLNCDSSDECKKLNEEQEYY